MKVSDILKAKGSECECIEPNKTVKEAMQKISEKKIGALLVTENDTPVGIITERDIFVIVASGDMNAFSQPVEKFMTKNMVVGVPDDEIDVAMAYMTNNRFRHLPIVENKKVVGIISIGDIIKSEVHNLKVQNRYLSDYISGKYPG